MNQLRWRGALIGGFALAIAAGIYLGDGQPRVVPSHEFAFVMTDVCPDDPQYSGCSSIYIAHAEAVGPPLRHQDPRALPAGTQKVLTRAERITGLRWSPNGAQLVYLTTKVVLGTYLDHYVNRVRYDQWVINADGSGNRQTNTDVLFFGLVNSLVVRVDGALVDGKSVSRDGTLIAFNASFGDLRAICVSTGGVDAVTRRCFGDGAFGPPVWRPN